MGTDFSSYLSVLTNDHTWREENANVKGEARVGDRRDGKKNLLTSAELDSERKRNQRVSLTRWERRAASVFIDGKTVVAGKEAHLSDLCGIPNLSPPLSNLPKT